MRKEQLDNWIKNGGQLPENLEESEKDYLKSLGWHQERGWYDVDYGMKQLEWEVNYIDDAVHGNVPHGIYREWYEHGQLEHERSYLRGEVIQLRDWTRNGQILSDRRRLRGKRHGVHRIWTEDGELYRHEEYAYGVLLRDFLK